MANISVLVIDSKQNILSGVTVKAQWKDFFGGQQKVEEITDSSGKVSFNLNLFQQNLEIIASKSGSIDKETIDINIFGWANPDNIILELQFKPFEEAGDSLGDLKNLFVEHSKTIVLGGTIIGSIVAVIYIISLAKSQATKGLPLEKINLKSPT